MKEVVIVGPMERAKDYSQDAQIWCINYSYKNQGRCDYVFHMDPIDVEKEEFFVKDMNALGCLVISTRAYKEIPNSVAYPLDKVVEFFGGVRYFTSTIAYAMALAIATKVDRITMPGLNYVNDGWEYASQKPCLDFWAGVAVGRGIQFKLPKESGLARPWIWDPDLYGYVDNKIIPCAIPRSRRPTAPAWRTPRRLSMRSLAMMLTWIGTRKLSCMRGSS